MSGKLSCNKADFIGDINLVTLLTASFNISVLFVVLMSISMSCHVVLMISMVLC